MWVTGAPADLVVDVHRGRVTTVNQLEGPIQGPMLVLDGGGVLLAGRYRPGFDVGERPPVADPGVTFPYLMRLDADLERVWFQDLTDTTWSSGRLGGISSLHRAADGTVIAEGQLGIGQLDPETGASLWTLPDSSGARVDQAAALPGGAAMAYVIGPLDVLPWRGAPLDARDGFVRFDDEGQAVDGIAVARQEAPGGGAWLVSGDTLWHWTGRRLLVRRLDDLEAATEVSWASSPSDTFNGLAAVHPDGEGGVWAEITVARPDLFRLDCGGDDTGTVFHLDPSGACTRYAGTFGERSAVRLDGATASMARRGESLVAQLYDLDQGGQADRVTIPGFGNALDVVAGSGAFSETGETFIGTWSVYRAAQAPPPVLGLAAVRYEP